MTEFEKTVKTMKPSAKPKKIGEGRFGARLAVYENGYKAVIKPQMEGGVFRRQRTERAPYCEEAFYHFSQLIYPGVVPETYTIKLNGHVWSAQLFVPGFHVRQYDAKLFNKEREDFLPNLRRVCFAAAPKQAWKRLSLLDLLGNSRDRHGKNVLIRPKHVLPLAAIDNSFALGLTFRGTRNVFHQYLFYWQWYDPALLREVSKLTVKDFKGAICPLLEPIFAEHCARRLEWVLEYPHRLPWRIISQGAERSVEFPSYAPWFKKHHRQLPQRPMMVKAA